MASDFKDFYIKFPGHPKFNDVEIIEDEIIKVIIQKIEMIIFTNRGELLGDPDFGADMLRYLHSTSVNADFVKSDLAQQFSRYIPELSNIGYELDVKFAKNPVEFSDIMLVSINIRGFEVNAFFN